MMINTISTTISLSELDYAILIGFFTLTLAIGIIVSKKSGKNTAEYFLSARSMPWWLLGLSMVATTFSTDTPNLVTDIVRTSGVAGNWVWWAFLLTGLLTVFVYAKLWRKSEVSTDIEFYELRYSGKAAVFLRRFRAVYLGLFFNVLAMAGVTLAAIKIGQVMLGLSPFETIGAAGLITVIFSAIGGFRGVVYTDFLLFFLAMAGSIGAAIFLVNHESVGGLEALLNNPIVSEKLAFVPSFDNKEVLVMLFVIPLAVQWWSVWYPGAEPGGGGYIAQRMLAAKNENHAIGATFFFNIMHYALRPWPWILVALASLVVFPDLESIQVAFPAITEDKLGQDLAYSAMMTLLPSGLLGVVLTSLVAAYMSTISTHLNWGSSYLVNDFYKQQINPQASEKELVRVGRWSTVLLMILSSGIALLLTNALQLFDFIIMFGAGTGLLFILRWFWWRINAWSEISAMLASGVISILFTQTSLGPSLFGEAGIFEGYWQFPAVVLITTVIWLTVTFLTPPDKSSKLISFYKKTNPGGPGWRKIRANQELSNLESQNKPWYMPHGIACMLSASVAIYAILFATGYLIYGQVKAALIMIVLALVSSVCLKFYWKKLKSIS